MSAREEMLELIEDMGLMLRRAAEEGVEDLDGSIYAPSGAYSREHYEVKLWAMRTVGDLIEDWARDLIINPYGHDFEEM
jgi:hypothetical protein